MSNLDKIIRSICIFSTIEQAKYAEKKLLYLQSVLQACNFEIQTLRICFENATVKDLEYCFEHNKPYLYALGSLNRIQANTVLPAFLETKWPVSFNYELQDAIQMQDVMMLFKIIQEAAHKTFNFCFSFNPAVNSPFFPSASFSHKGFALGLQSTNLSADCGNTNAWLKNMQDVWDELMSLFEQDKDFLGIDSSVAPLYNDNGSFVHVVKRFEGPLENACCSNFFTSISSFIKTKNPKPVGLNGLMFPCLEDFELAACYEQGQFSIERNLFLSMHSGLGIDTYPIGLDESPQKVLDILSLMQALSNKYNKPLSARFVSDGIAKIGNMTNFKNPYLKDVCIRRL